MSMMRTTSMSGLARQRDGKHGDGSSASLIRPQEAEEPSPCFPQLSTYLRIAGIVKESIVDGPGIRFTVFTQGCNHHCPGCHNPQTHDFDGGNEVSIDSIVEQIKKNPLLDGITLSGGEPFEQAAACSELARRVHAMKLNVMTYSGYTYDEIIAGFANKSGWRELLHDTDILVDGRFILEKRNILLKFRGSENQRLIDIKKSLKEGIPISIA